MKRVAELPPTWAWSTFGEIADVQLGRQRSPKNHDGPHMRPYLRAANVTWNGLDLSDVKAMNFDPNEAGRFELRFGDIILNEASGSPNEVGKPAIWRDEIAGCCFQNTLLRLRSDHLDLKYLFWYCNYLARSGQFGEAGRGVNIRHLGKRGLSALPVPVPPSSEQTRIAEAIEVHLDGLRAANGSLAGADARIETLEATATAEVFDPNWPHADLIDLLEVFSDCPHRTPEYRDDGRYPALRPRDVVRGSLNLTEAALVDESEYEKQVAREVPRPGDVVYGRELSYGWAAVLPTPSEVCLSQGMVLMRPLKVSSRYLTSYLNSAAGRQQAHKAATGSAHPHLNLRDIKRYQVPVPPSEEAASSAVAKLEEIRGGCQRLRESVQTGHRRGESLRRSILAAAFSGQLAPQDPSDEPVDVLIERIRAEKPTKKRRSTKVSS